MSCDHDFTLYIDDEHNAHVTGHILNSLYSHTLNDSIGFGENREHNWDPIGYMYTPVSLLLINYSAVLILHCEHTIILSRVEDTGFLS